MRWYEFLVSDAKGNEVTVAFFPKVLFAQLVRTLKNFAILFAGCAFICFAFIRLLSHSEQQPKNDIVLAQVKPLLLVTVLMESLMAPVLPQYLTQIAVENGAGESWSSYFFTLYFVGFAATLLPVSRLVEVFDIRKVLGVGILLSAAGCLLLAYESQLAMVLIARFTSGVGQATIFIAVQGYILRCSDQSNKTQAAGIIVFCFNAGFISGAAIGALLADTVGVQGIFMLSALVGGTDVSVRVVAAVDDSSGECSRFTQREPDDDAKRFRCFDACTVIHAHHVACWYPNQNDANGCRILCCTNPSF